MFAKVLTVALLCGLGGCVARVPADPLVPVRTDGRAIYGNAAMEQQANIDATVCQGQTGQSASNMQPYYTNGSISGAIASAYIDAQRSKTLNDVAAGCLAQKGYMMVPRSQAEVTRMSFSRTAAARANARVD